MGAMSRSKGKEGERQVVNRFKAHGVECRRLWEEQSKPGGQQDGDLGFTFDGVYAEVRRRERLRIPEWIREVAEKAPPGYSRALIFRRNREDWNVCVPLDDYIRLLGGGG